MTTAVAFSRQNDAGSRTSTTEKLLSIEKISYHATQSLTRTFSDNMEPHLHIT